MTGPTSNDDTGTWSPPLGVLLSTRWLLGLAAVQGQLHALGGTGPAGAPLKTHEAYNPATKQWSTLQSMPTARSMLTTAGMDNHLYAIGGFSWPPSGDRTPLSTNEMFDVTTGTWTTCAPMPTARGLAAAGVVQGQIHVVGGQQANQAVATHEVYDPATNAWSPLTALSTPRAGIATTVVNDTMFLCGGAGDDEVVLDTVETWNPANGSFTTQPSMPTARWLAGGTSAQNQVFVIGGSAFSTEEPVVANESYDPVSQHWASQDPLPVNPPGWWTAQAAGISSLLEGRIYVLQYNTTNEQTQLLEYLTSPFGTPLAGPIR